MSEKIYVFKVFERIWRWSQAGLITHIHLTTAGHTPTSHIKAMITGWEEVD